MERKVASDYPQELLDLFHEYQHGDISRRTFLDRAAKFAVGGLRVAKIFESLRPNYAWAQQVPPTTNASRWVTKPCSRRKGTVRSKVTWRGPQRVGNCRLCLSSTRTADSIPTSRMLRGGLRLPTS